MGGDLRVVSLMLFYDDVKKKERLAMRLLFEFTIYLIYPMKDSKDTK